MNKNLPHNWTTIKLEDTFFYKKGKKPITLYSKPVKKSVPYLDIKAFEKNIYSNYCDPDDAVIIDENEIAIVWDGARSGWVSKGITGALGSTLAALKTIEINSSYPFKFLQYKFDYINSNVRGIGIPHVDPEKLWDIEMPVPPVNEINRISKKLDAIFSHIDSLNSRIESIPEILKQFRQQVLSYAVSGKLTESWRKKNSKKGLIQTKSKKEKFDSFILPTLPNGWAWQKLEKLISDEKNALKAGPFGSSLKKAFYVSKGYKIYGQEQVIKEDPYYGNYYINEKKYKELESCRVQPNDILVSLVGTIGKVLILPKDCAPGIINPRLVKISLNSKLYNSSFFKIYFSSSVLIDHYKSLLHGSTMDVLNLGIIKSLPYPTPPLEEQIEIVRRVEKLFALAGKIEERYKNAKLAIEELPHAVLKKTFEGKLLKQNPKDEPAIKLVERIMKTKVDHLENKNKKKKQKIN